METTSLLTQIANQEPLFGISFTTWIVIIIGLLILKGFAMWKAAENKSKGWFWTLFLLNTIGILDAYYLFIRRKK